MALIRDLLGAIVARSNESRSPPADERLIRSSTLLLDDLYRSEAPKLLRFFNRRVDYEDSQDLVQESFVRLAAADRMRESEIERPAAFLNRIATNALKNQSKSAYERVRAGCVPAEDAGLRAPDLLSELEARDLINRVQQALMRLKPKTRDIFLAHRVDGLSYDEIAQRTGLAKKGVAWHMRKAIAHLDRALRDR